MQINRLNLKPLENLPAGTEGDIAVCDGQLFLYTSNWNPISNSYTPWCFNSGTVDQFGFATCFEIEQNSILKLKADSVFTSANGLTQSVNQDLQFNLTQFSEAGDYNAFIDTSNNTQQIRVYQNTIYISAEQPNIAVQGDIWLDISVVPFNCKTLNASSEWILSNNLVPIPCNPLSISI